MSDAERILEDALKYAEEEFERVKKETEAIIKTGREAQSHLDDARSKCLNLRDALSILKRNGSEASDGIR